MKPVPNPNRSVRQCAGSGTRHSEQHGVTAWLQYNIIHYGVHILLNVNRKLFFDEIIIKNACSVQILQLNIFAAGTTQKGHDLVRITTLRTAEIIGPGGR